MHKIFAVLTIIAILAAGVFLYRDFSRPYILHDLRFDTSDISQRHLHLRLLLPKGKTGPFPLVIINHGSPSSRQGREQLNDLRFTVLSEWFLHRGFTVAIPLRRGYGTGGGEWNEHYVSCDTPHYFRAGLETAKDIIAAQKFLTHRSDIIPDKTIIIGQSAGGWGALAVASLNPTGIIGIVNFAGGRGGIAAHKLHHNCNASELIWAAGTYGKTARIPSLWLYAENDNSFPPELVNAMFNAYQSDNDTAFLYIVPPVGDNGHHMAMNKEGQSRWEKPLGLFLGDIIPQ